MEIISLVFTKALRSSNKQGFSLLELLVAILIIGLLSALIVPNIGQVTPRYEREEFIARFNTLVQYGWQQALSTHLVHRVTVDIGKKIITLDVASEQKDASGELIFKPIADAAYDTQCLIPEQIQIKQFFIEGYDMMTKFARGSTASTWFYIIPEGMVQSVVINFMDTKDTRDNEPLSVSLVINPFIAQFKIYDTFQKP